MTSSLGTKEEDKDLIAGSIEFISDESAELPTAINCPISFIIEIVNKLLFQ